MTSEDPRPHGLSIIVALIGYVVLSAKLGIRFSAPVAIFGAISAAIVLRGVDFPERLLAQKSQATQR